MRGRLRVWGWGGWGVGGVGFVVVVAVPGSGQWSLTVAIVLRCGGLGCRLQKVRWLLRGLLAVLRCCDVGVWGFLWRSWAVLPREGVRDVSARFTLFEYRCCGTSAVVKDRPDSASGSFSLM